MALEYWLINKGHNWETHEIDRLEPNARYYTFKARQAWIENVIEIRIMNYGFALKTPNVI